MKHKFKVGDLVRVPASTASTGWHCYKPGQVVEVVNLRGHCGSTDHIMLQGGLDSREVKQAVKPGPLKLAKQAMRKRDKYEARRG